MSDQIADDYRAGVCTAQVTTNGDCAASFSTHPELLGKRVAMVSYSSYPGDPRPRRAVKALIDEGMKVDLLCRGDGKSPRRETFNGLEILRVPIKHTRGGKLAYFYEYSAFIGLCSAILASRSLRHRYDLVYVHNMPDILVLCALLPKALGARVVLDLHDPMPELMTTIFNLGSNSPSVRIIRTLEKWSMTRADLVLTVNVACKRIFASRSCDAAKIGVVMNSPDSEIFPFQPCAPPVHVSGRPFVIMYHGSIVERNGLDVAIDAVQQVRKVVPLVEFRIFGSKTPFLEQVMEKVRQEKLEGCVHYLGPRRLEDLVPEIKNCDVGVIPNQLNPFTEINTPTRIFEYLALGKPVIAPATSGIQDYFPEDALIFFEAGNAADLACKIEHVLAHPNATIETAERGQQIYRTHTWSQEKETLVNMIDRLLNPKEAE